jgi:hypothetical protein
MKFLVLACLLVASPAFAEDPSTAGSTTGSTIDTQSPGSPPSANDEAGTPGENEPAPPPPAPDTTPKARMTNPIPRAPLHHVKDDGESRLDKVENEVAGGKHWRIMTPNGAVHVWVPSGYDRATAGTVVYVHGYYVDVDTAWREYNLARQFRASHQNALFIVPEAPAGNDDAVNWPALKDLRRAVARANITLPDGPVIVMGHSGAFRTIMQWVDHRLIEQIILLDAMYAGESAFDEYIGSGKRADEHKLIVVGASTAQESAGFAHKYKFAVAREKMPSSVSGFTRRERNARLLYVRSQYEHMAIVTSGKVIPTLLHLTPLKAL